MWYLKFIVKKKTDWYRIKIKIHARKKTKENFNKKQNHFQNPGHNHLDTILSLIFITYTVKVKESINLIANYSLLFCNNQESFNKGIAFYEKALTLVDIQDNSAIKRIDTVTVKPGKEEEFKQLIQEMDVADLLTQKYK